MRRMFAAASVAAAVGFIGCQGAAASAVAPAAVKETTAAGPSLQPTQYRARRTRRGYVKCYRELLIGRYRCHYYRRRWW